MISKCNWKLAIKPVQIHVVAQKQILSYACMYRNETRPSRAPCAHLQHQTIMDICTLNTLIMVMFYSSKAAIIHSLIFTIHYT